MGRATANVLLVSSPGTLGRNQKVKYHLILITKSISKFLYPNFVCVLTYEIYNTYQTGFLFCRLGHQGWDFGALGVPSGVKTSMRGLQQNASKILILWSNW